MNVNRGFEGKERISLKLKGYGSHMAKCGFSNALKSKDIFGVDLRDDLDMVESTRFRFLNDDFSTTALFAMVPCCPSRVWSNALINTKSPDMRVKRAF